GEHSSDKGAKLTESALSDADPPPPSRDPRPGAPLRSLPIRVRTTSQVIVPTASAAIAGLLLRTHAGTSRRTRRPIRLQRPSPNFDVPRAYGNDPRDDQRDRR